VPDGTAVGLRKKAGEVVQRTTLQVNGIDHVVLNVSNLEASKALYMDILGFGFRTEFARPDSKMCFLRCGAQGLDLAEAPAEAIHGRTEMNHMALRVAEGTIEEIVAELAKVGLAPVGVSHDPNTVFILDPDGHRVELLSVPAQVAMDEAKRAPVPA
jgi:catechol 2,3-dioxygenase-like lactoylglutathione lyase family enzyme